MELIIAGTILVMLLIPTTTYVYAGQEETQVYVMDEEERESGFYNENGHPKLADRPAINPDFAPDKSCSFDVYQLQCIPGLEQSCSDVEGFERNEDGQCHPTGDCPEDYHYAFEDESGQYYPNDEGCIDEGFVLTEREEGGDICAPEGRIN